MSNLIKMIVINNFGEPMEREGEIKATRIHGFEKAGNWSLYGLGEEWAPCEEIAIRWKGRRKAVWVPKSRITSGLPK